MLILTFALWCLLFLSLTSGEWGRLEPGDGCCRGSSSSSHPLFHQSSGLSAGQEVTSSSPSAHGYTVLSPRPHLTTNENWKPSLARDIREHNNTWLPNMALFGVHCDAGCLSFQLLCSPYVYNHIGFYQQCYKHWRHAVDI